MKYKGILIILFILIMLLSGLYVYSFFYTKEDEKKVPERSKIEYIMGDISYPQALKKGEDYFLETINLLRGDTLKFTTNEKDEDIIYVIDKVDGYRQILNYSDLNKFLSHNAIENFNNHYEIKYYENKFYLKNYDFTKNNNYIGSIIQINGFDENYIKYDVTSYYCSNGSFEGILKEKPSCDDLEEVNSIFSLVKENNLLKVNDISELWNIKKIY